MRGVHGHGKNDVLLKSASDKRQKLIWGVYSHGKKDGLFNLAFNKLHQSA